MVHSEFTLPYYILVIDTDSFRGIPRRELTSFCTGVACRHVEFGHAQMFKDDYGIPKDTPSIFEKAVLFDTTTRGDFSFDYPTPGWFRNGWHKHFRDGEEDKAALAGARTYIKYMQKNGSYMAETPEECMQGATKNGRFTSKYPALLSAAIVFKRRPSVKMIDIIKKRAVEFAVPEIVETCCWNDPPAFSITGFRLVYCKFTEEETAL